MSLKENARVTQQTKILAVGAAGQFAGLVVPELAKRGATVRALIRHSTHEHLVRGRGATEVAIGDLTNRSSLEAALVGIDSVFYIAPVFLHHEAEIGKQIVEAAVMAGARRFVFSSIFQPCLSVLENHRAKGPVEEAVLATGMEYTFMHPVMFFQNYNRPWDEIVKRGVIAEPFSAQSRFARVDYRDVAEVAAIALTDDRLLYGTFDLYAEGNLNRLQLAKLIGEVLGRSIQATSLPFDDWSRQANIPSSQIGPMKTMFDWYDTHELLGNALALRTILGREPRTLRGYFQELASRTFATGYASVADSGESCRDAYLSDS